MILEILINTTIRICSILLYSLSIVFSQNLNEITKFDKEYFGLKAPKHNTEIFLDEIISQIGNDEMCAAFSNNGCEFYFNAKHKGVWTIFVTTLKNGNWEKPKPINFTNGYIDRDFTVSPHGDKLFFGSNRPRKPGDKKLNSLDIYFSEKLRNGNWCEPINAGQSVNSNYNENYPSIDNNNNLYFFSNRKEGVGGSDIYYSKFENDEYLTPYILGTNINSNKNDWDSFISPDGSYIIFSSQNRDDTLGKQDLYISYNDQNGNWTKAVNMGPKINSKEDEICPSVSSDGRSFFFTSRRRGDADIYWFDASIIDLLRYK